MTDEELAQEMESRGFPAIAAAIRRPVVPEPSLKEACPWLVEDGRHVNGEWVPDPLPRQLRIA